MKLSEASLDVPLLIRHRLRELGVEQKDLASAAAVTESYISQLLARKKAPPAPARTDLYDKLESFLKLPNGELSKLAELQRLEELKKKAAEPAGPLFGEYRELILRKCDPGRRAEIESIFAKQPFGELERLVTQTLLTVSQRVAREELRSEEWLRLMAQLSGRSYEQMRVVSLEFLDTDVFHVSPEGCTAFLEPIIDSWDIDLTTFAIDIVLNRRLAPGGLLRFEFVEIQIDAHREAEPGFEKFLSDPLLSADITEEEIAFLKGLAFSGKHPSPIYYYRELQNLRDPLHFPPSPQPKGRPRTKTL
jgi:hypothetical protein